MTIGSFIAWLGMVAFSALGTCAMCDALTPLMLTVAGVFFGLFFSFIAFAPALMRDDSKVQRCTFCGRDHS